MECIQSELFLEFWKQVFGVTDDTVRRMESLCFFDEVVTRDLLFLSVHDAILFIRLETSVGTMSDPIADKVYCN